MLSQDRNLFGRLLKLKHECEALFYVQLIDDICAPIQGLLTKSVRMQPFLPCWLSQSLFWIWLWIHLHTWSQARIWGTILGQSLQVVIHFFDLWCSIRLLIFASCNRWRTTGYRSWKTSCCWNFAPWAVCGKIDGTFHCMIFWQNESLI